MPNILTYPTRNANASANSKDPSKVFDGNNFDVNPCLQDRYYSENRSGADERSSRGTAARASRVMRGSARIPL